MSTEPGGLVETSDDGTLLHFIDLDGGERPAESSSKSRSPSTFVSKCWLAKVISRTSRCTKGSTRSWPVRGGSQKTLSRSGKRPDSARSGACSDVLRRAAEWLRARDVDGDALRRALRAAIVVPIAGMVSYSVAGLSQTALFTLLGAIWLLGLVDFPGNRRVRAPAYCGLGFNGAVLITIGTLVQPIPWLAVALTFVLGAAVTLAGVLSETIAAGRRVTLLLCVLPVCTPPAPVTARLLGWAIAFAICVPAALFLFPPRHDNDLRRHAAQVCTALADRLDGLGSGDEVSSAMRALEKNFMSADHRPVGLTAGSRALVRVVDDLKWLTDRVGNDEDVGLADMQAAVVAVLRCCARTLNAAARVQKGRRAGGTGRQTVRVACSGKGTLPRGRGRSVRRRRRPGCDGARAGIASAPHDRDVGRPDRPDDRRRSSGRRPPRMGQGAWHAAAGDGSRRPVAP